MGINYFPERNYDNRQIVHATPRYRGTKTCFSSLDDDQTNPTLVGGGSNHMCWTHVAGVDPLTQTIYWDLNTITNKTYLLTGMFSWKGCTRDRWSCSVVPRVTTTSAGTNTNFALYGGYLIIPAAGDGDITVNPADMKLVQNTPDEFGNMPAGYWDADFNTTTKQFENITANPNGTGAYNMFAVEVPFHKYVTDFCLVGDGQGSLTAFDADQVGHGIRLKFEFQTIGTDHDWEFGGTIVMFRERTV